MSGEFRFLPEQASSFAGDVDLLYAFLWGVSGDSRANVGDR